MRADIAQIASAQLPIRCQFLAAVTTPLSGEGLEFWVDFFTTSGQFCGISALVLGPFLLLGVALARFSRQS